MSDELTIRNLRRRWRPHKERLQTQCSDHSTNIRMHRSFSWLDRADQFEGDHDMALICRWIAFNSFYGRWDADRGEPVDPSI